MAPSGAALSPVHHKISQATALFADRTMATCLPPGDVCVVNGFWRSGTTWLQQNLARAVGAKTIFEPFDWAFPVYRRVAREFHPFRGRDHEESFFPYFDNRENFPRIWPYLDTVFKGFAGGTFALNARDSWRDSFRRKLVVKFVNASLSLSAIHAKYGVPVVHIRRHPCAVVASLKNVKNWPWSFDEVRIEDLLLAPADGRAAVFDAYRDVIVQCDHAGIDAKIAAYWALTEAYVQETLANAPWALIVHYEELVADPEGGFKKISDFLDCEDWSAPDYEANSALTEKDREGVPARHRTDDWHNRLSSTEIDTIMTLADKLFPGFAAA